MQHNQQQAEQCVFRSIAFPLSTFDYLKDFQRDYERRHGVHLTNNQALTIIIKEHQQASVERGEQYGAPRRN